MDDSGFSDEEEPVVHQRAVEGKEWDLSNLPRVELRDILESYDAVSVGNELGHEYIVVAPKVGYSEPQAPSANAPSRTFASQADVTRMHMEMIEREEKALALATGRTIPAHTRPLRQQGVSTDPNPDTFRTGIGANSGEIRQHPVVDFTRGIGVSNDNDLTSELGSAVASPWTSFTRREYNRDLIGLQGLQVYDKMRKSDGTVRGTLRLAKTPVLSAMWGIKPASDSTRDKNVAQFIWNCLTTWQSMSWPQFVTESLLMLDFGYYMFEKVFARGADTKGYTGPAGRVVWKKFAPRHPMDVKEWFFDYNGGPLSVDMWGPPQSVQPTLQAGVIQAIQQWINIPIDKLLVFTFDKEAGNIEGISVLRTAYKHWYYKDNLYKIDAIQKERHGIGVPVIQLPMGYSTDDKNLADQLGRNLRTNERAHVVLPPGWVMSFAELKGQPVSCLESIQHHDEMIPAGILGRWFATSSTDTEEQHSLFLKATRFTADIVLDTLNKFAIPQLVDMNWSRVGYPTLYAKRIGEQEEWRTESFTLRNYVGAGIIVPDDGLEAQIRDEMGYPPPDPKTARLVHTAQNRNIAQPAPGELPGSLAQIADMIKNHPEQLSPDLLTALGLNPQASGAVPAAGGPPKPTLPRQGAPGVVKPSTGRGDGSGSSGRSGQ